MLVQICEHSVIPLNFFAVWKPGFDEWTENGDELNVVLTIEAVIGSKKQRAIDYQRLFVLLRGIFKGRQTVFLSTVQEFQEIGFGQMNKKRMETTTGRMGFRRIWIFGFRGILASLKGSFATGFFEGLDICC